MSTISERIENLSQLLTEAQADAVKSDKGNKAAGTRARKGLRSLKTTAAELVKLTLGKE